MRPVALRGGELVKLREVKLEINVTTDEVDQRLDVTLDLGREASSDLENKTDALAVKPKPKGKMISSSKSCSNGTRNVSSFEASINISESRLTDTFAFKLSSEMSSTACKRQRGLARATKRVCFAWAGHTQSPWRKAASSHHRGGAPLPSHVSGWTNRAASFLFAKCASSRRWTSSSSRSLELSRASPLSAWRSLPRTRSSWLSACFFNPRACTTSAGVTSASRRIEIRSEKSLRVLTKPSTSLIAVLIGSSTVSTASLTAWGFKAAVVRGGDVQGRRWSGEVIGHSGMPQDGVYGAHFD